MSETKYGIIREQGEFQDVKYLNEEDNKTVNTSDEEKKKKNDNK